MRVLIALSVSQFLHQTRRCVSEVHRHGQIRLFHHILPCFAVGRVDRVALVRGGQIDGCVRNGQIALRAAQKIVRVPCGQCNGKRPGVGVADVFGREPDHATEDVVRVFARFHHACQPIQRRVRVAVPQALVKRRNQIVVFLAALVVQKRLAAHRRPDGLRGQPFARAQGRRGHFQDVQRASGVSLRRARNRLEGIGVGADVRQPAPVAGKRGVQDIAYCRDVQQIQNEHLRARKQCRVHLERRVFSRGSDQTDGTVFDMRQKRVLLRPIEPVNLVDEQGGPPPRLAVPLSAGNDFPHLFHPGGNRAERREPALRGVGHETRERGLSRSGRSPEDHRRRPVAFDQLAKRRPRRREMILPADLIQAARPHPVRKRRLRFEPGEQIIPTHSFSSAGATATSAFAPGPVR